METKTYYFKKLKGVDGLRWYYVGFKKDIPYLGSLKSNYTSDIKQFKRLMAKYYNIKVKVVKI